MRRVLITHRHASLPLHLLMLEERSVPAITGFVFQDFNANGDFDTATTVVNNGQGTISAAVDRGVAGVTVAAYDATNAVVGLAVTDALGNYVLSVTGSGPFRIEFTGLPNGIFFGAAGISTGTSVQFVSDSNAANVNLALVRPEDISPNNPTLVTQSYHVGGIENYDLNPGSGVILGFPYTAGSADGDPVRENHQNPTTHDLSITQRQVGTTWGLAYDADRDRLFAAAFMKRTSGFGPGGPGAIYVMPTTGREATLYADLNSIFGDHPAGNLAALYTDIQGNPVPFRQGITDANYWFFDGLVRFTDQQGVVRELGWDAVGKIALGGLDTDDANTRLFTVALADRRLYSLPTIGALNASTVQRYDIPIPTSVTGRSAANPLGDLRPFAVEYHRGLVYVGAVNSAESTQNAADLKAYVFAFDPARGVFINRTRAATTTEAVFEFDLNYPRGHIHLGQDPLPGGIGPADPAAWNPWVPTHRIVQQQPEALGRSGYPQPMLTGLSFDREGNLVIGLRDRSGDQIGRNVPINPDELNNFSYFSITAGDLLRAFINAPLSLDQTSAPLAGWTLESNGRSPDGRTGTSPQNTGQGPGGGEFYFDDDFPHDPNSPPIGFIGPENDEVSNGGVLQIPGFRHTLTTAFDPVRVPGAVNGGGVRWFDSATGAVIKTYELYVTPFNNGTNTFAKGNGTGDLVAITMPRPLEIGNFVWLDANRNGIQDAGEQGIANVVVELYDADGRFIASAVTDASGNYIFSSGVGTRTASRVYGLNLTPNTEYILGVRGSQSALAGLSFTQAAADGSANGTARDSNVDLNGLARIRTGRSGTADHSFDIGLVPPPVVVPPPPPPRARNGSISGHVFRDNCPVDGIYDPTRGEIGLAGVRITLIGDTIEGRIERSTFTDSNGAYLFSALPSGTYIIQQTQPTGFYDGPDTLGNLGGTILANDTLALTLTDAQFRATDYNFAEFAPNAIFGYVYQDVNENRRFDSVDVGIPDVLIAIRGTVFAGTPLARPLTAADSLGGLTTRTDAFGRWEFPMLPPGVFEVFQTQPAGFEDFFESAQEPVSRSVLIGNDIFSEIGLCNGVTRGLFNFGERAPVELLTKRAFLGSTTGGITVPPSDQPGVLVESLDVRLDPAFSVSTGTPGMPAFVVVAGGEGRSPLLRVFDYAAGRERFRFFAYEENYRGGVRVATGDIDGDGIPDIITATGVGGGPRVRVFSGFDGRILRDFFAYEAEFRGGVFVAAADVNGDGRADIITGTELGGGPRVTVFDGATNTRLHDFFAFDSNQRGGVRVAAADFNGDGRADLVTTTGRGVPTRVRVFDAVDRTLLSDFVPYDARFTGGVFIAAGDVNGDVIADVVTSADVGGGPHVQVFNGLTGSALYGFFSDNVNFRGGVRIALQDVDGDGAREIITANGPGAPARVRIWKNGVLTPIEEFHAFDTSYTGGVFVG